jgi:hypothetical protein
MSLVADPDLPAWDYPPPGAPADRYHQQLAEGIYGIDKLAIIWPGSSTVSPNHGPGPDVS